MIEYEVSILKVNKDKLIQRIIELGGIVKGEYLQRRYTYDFSPVEKNKWIRLRTNGIKTTLTIKEVKDETIVGGTHETETEVSSFEDTHKILNELGYNYRNYQENSRIICILNDVEIDIDTWPMIPTYAEVEGKDEDSVMEVVKLINLDNNEVVTCSPTEIYLKYGIDVLSIRELRLNN